MNLWVELLHRVDLELLRELRQGVLSLYTGAQFSSCRRQDDALRIRLTRSCRFSLSPLNCGETALGLAKAELWRAGRWPFPRWFICLSCGTSSAGHLAGRATIPREPYSFVHPKQAWESEGKTLCLQEKLCLAGRIPPGLGGMLSGGEFETTGPSPLIFVQASDVRDELLRTDHGGLACRRSVQLPFQCSSCLSGHLGWK